MGSRAADEPPLDLMGEIRAVLAAHEHLLERLERLALVKRSPVDAANGRAPADATAFPGGAHGAFVPAMPTLENAATIGARITLKRQQADLSRRKLCRLAEITEWQLRTWETDAVTPSVPNLLRLIPHIGGSLDFYYGADQ